MTKIWWKRGRWHWLRTGTGSIKAVGGATKSLHKALERALRRP